jgi:hypothetical protein
MSVTVVLAGQVVLVLADRFMGGELLQPFFIILVKA